VNGYHPFFYPQISPKSQNLKQSWPKYDTFGFDIFLKHSSRDKWRDPQLAKVSCPWVDNRQPKYKDSHVGFSVKEIDHE
jgi:hypothetical protein